MKFFWGGGGDEDWFCVSRKRVGCLGGGEGVGVDDEVGVVC